MMAQHDTDKDGQLSRTELESAQQAASARRLQAFDAADTNKDGKLAAEEMRAFRESMRAQLGTPGARKAAHRHGEPGSRGQRPGDAAPTAPVTPLPGA
jgi:Ca2+-binding EF-hand superfamily protein